MWVCVCAITVISMYKWKSVEKRSAGTEEQYISVFSQLTSTEIYSILEDASNYRLFRVKCMGGTGQAIGHH